MKNIVVFFLSLLLINHAFAAQSLLGGKFYGANNSKVTIVNNGSEELSVAINSSQNFPYDLVDFKFQTAKNDGETYSLSLKDISPGYECSIYKGQTGILPVNPNNIRIGCEKKFDFASLGNSPSERGTFYYSSHPATGGASLPIGKTTQAYGEGRFVAFSSSLPIAGSKGKKRQIFFRDRYTGETTLISKDVNGVEGNGDSTNPAISADGLTIAFESVATNLDGLPDTNNMRDIFVWNAQNSSRGIIKVSTGINEIEANSESFDPSLSGDGRIISFASSASNLTPGVISTSTVNIYLKNLETKEMTLLSVDNKGVGVGGAYPSISEDGSRVAFYSFSAKLTADDTNNLWDIFVYDHTAKFIKRVSFTTLGGERNSGSESISHMVPPVISGNGKFVTFSTTATNMSNIDTLGKRNIYVADLENNKVILATAGIGGTSANGNSPIGQTDKVAISFDGSWIVFTSNSTNLVSNYNASGDNVFMRNILTGETKALTDKAGNSFGNPVMSRDAGSVVFGSSYRFDSTIPSSGFFSVFTGINRSFWWIE